jgi:serine/threonine protein kinase
MLYATLAGRYPFDTNMPEDARLEIMCQRPLAGLPAHLSPGCRDLLEQMLHPNPDARITVAAIKQHPWFLKDLPPGAADMADHYIKMASPCRRTPQEVEAVIQEALQRLAAGTVRAAAPAGAAVTARAAVPAMAQ